MTVILSLIPTRKGIKREAGADVVGGSSSGGGGGATTGGSTARPTKRARGKPQLHDVRVDTAWKERSKQTVRWYATFPLLPSNLQAKWFSLTLLF